MALDLPKQKRVRKRSEFDRIHRSGAYGKSSALRARILTGHPEGASTPPKIGVTVSSKVSKKATERNLWRRRIKEIFRTHQDEIKPNTWIVISVNPQAAGVMPQSGIEKEMLALLKAKNVLI